eukprot:255824-Rhodomonas_salina.1
METASGRVVWCERCCFSSVGEREWDGPRSCRRTCGPPHPQSAPAPAPPSSVSDSPRIQPRGHRKRATMKRRTMTGRESHPEKDGRAKRMDNTDRKTTDHKLGGVRHWLQLPSYHHLRRALCQFNQRPEPGPRTHRTNTVLNAKLKCLQQHSVKPVPRKNPLTCRPEHRNQDSKTSVCAFCHTQANHEHNHQRRVHDQEQDQQVSGKWIQPTQTWRGALRSSGCLLPSDSSTPTRPALSKVRRTLCETERHSGVGPSAKFSAGEGGREKNCFDEGSSAGGWEGGDMVRWRSESRQPEIMPMTMRRPFLARLFSESCRLHALSISAGQGGDARKNNERRETKLERKVQPQMRMGTPGAQR